MRGVRLCVDFVCERKEIGLSESEVERVRQSRNMFLF